LKVASTYAHISREDFEDWLKDLRGVYNPPFKVKSGTVGVYYLPLSDNVAVSISSTIGSREDAMGRGDASMQLRLVSLVTNRVLNAKAQGQSRFHRTTNWKDTWKKGILRMKDAYVKAAGFYDTIARIEDRERYARDLKAKIELIPNWSTTPIFSDFHKKLSDGGVLTVKQEAVILNATAKAKATPPPASNATLPLFPDLAHLGLVPRNGSWIAKLHTRNSEAFQERVLAHLRRVWKYFKDKKDLDTAKAVADFGVKISKGVLPVKTEWDLVQRAHVEMEFDREDEI